MSELGSNPSTDNSYLSHLNQITSLYLSFFFSEIGIMKMFSREGFVRAEGFESNDWSGMSGPININCNVGMEMDKFPQK